MMKSKAARMVWIDMRQPSESNKGGGAGQSEDDALLAKKENEHWWPGMRRWHMGLFMKDAILELGESEILSG